MHVANFNDEESGIDYYIASIGSSHHYADIMPETTSRDALIEIDLGAATMVDGHAYYLGVKVMYFTIFERKYCIWFLCL